MRVLITVCTKNLAFYSYRVTRPTSSLRKESFLEKNRASFSCSWYRFQQAFAFPSEKAAKLQGCFWDTGGDRGEHQNDTMNIISMNCKADSSRRRRGKLKKLELPSCSFFSLFFQRGKKRQEKFLA